MKLSVPDYILAIKPYVPGKPMKEVEREYGINNSIKLASNENPLGPSPMAIEAIKASMEEINRYPDGSGYYLIDRISEKLDVEPQNIVLGNGSDEIIGLLAHTLLQSGNEVIMPQSSFLMYEILVRSVGATPKFVPLKGLSIDLDGIRDRITPNTRMIFLTNPNNPTGEAINGKDVDFFLESLPPDIVVVIDEAYIEFIRDESCFSGITRIGSDQALVILRTFSKAYGLAGLRIGYGIMPGQLAGLLNRIRLPFNTNSLAQVGAIAALEDDKFLKKSIRLVHEGLDFFYSELDNLGIRYFPSQANFLLVDVCRNADEIFEAMLKLGVIVRSMVSYGYPEYIRVNVGLNEENSRFIASLKQVLSRD